MTETREQWIEREAREARARYWNAENLDRVSEAHKQLWRNVVAPYYPEPLRVPVDVDGLAEAICNAANASAPLFHLDWDETLFRDSYRAEARAALTYLNIETCDKPEYDPADVAFRRALKKSQEIVNNWTPEQRNHNSIGYVGLQDNERAELENLRVECKRLREEVISLLVEISKTNAKAERQRQALDANRKTIESRGAEIARLGNEVKRLRSQQPEARPVKVRFDVTAEELFWEMDDDNLPYPIENVEGIALVQHAMDHLSAHAVLEVPPGTQRREWTKGDVEELAEAICNAGSRVNNSFLCAEWHETYLRDNFRAGARAALAWFDGKRGDV